eukprot:jgi/Bigna1/140340/aug1.55_g15048
MTDSRIKAYLNVYDLVKYNAYVHWAGLGAYHTGIEINGVEWAYGHAERGTGVYPCLPGSHPNATLRERIELGDMDLTIHEVAECLERLRPAFSGYRYHLLYKNCNHFTEAFHKELTFKRPPSYINRLAAVARCLICCLPEYMQPRPGIDIPKADDAKGRRLGDECSGAGKIERMQALIYKTCFGDVEEEEKETEEDDEEMAIDHRGDSSSLEVGESNDDAKLRMIASFASNEDDGMESSHPLGFSSSSSSSRRRRMSSAEDINDSDMLIPRSPTPPISQFKKKHKGNKQQQPREMMVMSNASPGRLHSSSSTPQQPVSAAAASRIGDGRRSRGGMIAHLPSAEDLKVAQKMNQLAIFLARHSNRGDGGVQYSGIMRNSFPSGYSEEDLTFVEDEGAAVSDVDNDGIDVVSNNDRR